MNDYDYIIVGAGASGLMMAYRMSKDVFFDDKNILLIDKEKKNKNDRTWCFWEKGKGEWDDVLSTSWNTIEIASDIYTKKEAIFPYQYKMIRSKDFYQKIWKQLSNSTNISFIESDILEIFQEENNATVTTTTDIFYSKVVINSILFSDEYQTQTNYPVLQQHFVGFFIKTDEDSFDYSTATFMDFTVAQKSNTRFMYVLPINKREALFEYTLFSKDLLEIKEYEREIEKYLHDKNIFNYTITEKERGSIPMTCFEFWNSNSENIIHIGTAGGWSKASTGFTFKNINKKTSSLVQHLKATKPLINFHQKNRFWFYDLLLLDILSKNNELGAFIFGYLFQKNKSPKILKFLDEETSIFEELQIVLRMPSKFFVSALWKRLF
jgi:lycopene beta-cyclase